MSRTRNYLAIHAHFKNSAGPMKHRNTPRGGASNNTEDYLAEAERDHFELCQCEHCTVESFVDGDSPPRNWEF